VDQLPDREVTTGVAPEQLARTFVELADTLVDDYDLVDLLQMLTERCVELTGATEAGLLLANEDGALRVMAASRERTHLLELFQLQNREGPCLDCFRSGESVASTDLAANAERWPLFVPRAVSAGFHSVQAIPLRLRNQVLGALNLFLDEPGGISRTDVAVAQAMADVATISLLQERMVREIQLTAGQLQTALNSRVVLEQAKGILAEHWQVDPEDAFQDLRRFARDRNRKLSDVARAIVAGHLSSDEIERSR
jgi:GAF domain-containing protein